MPLHQLKQQLAEFTELQKTQFKKSEIVTLLNERSDFYDEILLSLWRSFGFVERQDLALVAVGGYGRREMFPLSDLDILVLCETAVDEPTLAKLNELFNLLWDAKLQVGSSVRTLAECIEIGKAELSVATNMLESRFLTGNQPLWDRLIEQIYQPDFWHITDFFTAKMQERNERYARYHNTSYNLEPDLKHSPGGLRDLHLVSWIILRHYRLTSFEQMKQQGLLFDEEYNILIQAQTVLFRMRFALHLQLKRYDNRLRFDRQLQLAEQLGYEGQGNQPVETMMRTFFQATQSISQLSQLLLASFEQKVLHSQQGLQKTLLKQSLDQHFYLQDNQIFAEDSHNFTAFPASILDLFYHLTQHPETSINVTLLRKLRLSLNQFNLPLCELAEARERFIQLFHQPNVVKRAIVPMHRLGVLNAYLPQWQGITGLMQFDLFHLYTVDEHTIRVMLKLESFLDPQSAEQHPLCSRLLPKMAIEERVQLLLSGLFHDIAKGREGEHSVNGAEEIYRFAKQHGFSEQQANQMAWLVAEHLTMSITAQRRDIHDPEVVRKFAETVEDLPSLEALLCLTVADICATNETLWNDWKRSLLTQLFQFTTQQLQIGTEKLIDYRQVGNIHRTQALELMKLTLSPTERKALSVFWQHAPESYFVRNSPKQLVWHALAWLRQKQLPMVLVSNEFARGATEIFVHCADQPQLFARIAQVLSQRKISIHDAQIITGNNSVVFDSFIVTEINGSALGEDRCRNVQQALLEILTAEHIRAFKPMKKPVKHQSFTRPTRLRFLANSQQNRTAFELFTLDREGLLAHIGHIFTQQALSLTNAKITTIGERVEDFFVVSKKGRALTENEQHELKERLLLELAE